MWAHGDIVVLRPAIEKTLFHRGRALLLDRVATEGSFFVGRFKVPAEICEGHEPRPNMPVMRGVEVPEMAFQLLGVLVAKLADKNPELAGALAGKAFAAREIIEAKFCGFVRPGDELVMQTIGEVQVGEVAGLLRFESKTILATVGGVKKCKIASVVITAFNPAMLASQEVGVSSR
jgi:3-hydroxymyristoyl/3-hydroxydecanoyl-(acyl carrier protein) dehydratase